MAGIEHKQHHWTYRCLRIARLWSQPFRHSSIVLTIAIVSLLIFNLYLFSWSRFANAGDNIVRVLPWTIMVLLAVRVLSPRYRDKVLTVLLVAMLTIAGTLIGSVIDFGRMGLQVLNDLCTPRVGNSASQDIIRMLILAPCTHICMMLGCFIGLQMFDQRAMSVFTVSARLFRLSLHIVGMFVGMFAGMLCLRLILNGEAFSATTGFFWSPIVFMWVGMFLGAVLTTYFAQRMAYFEPASS